MRRCPVCRALLIFGFCVHCQTYWPVITTEGAKPWKVRNVRSVVQTWKQKAIITKNFHGGKNTRNGLGNIRLIMGKEQVNIRGSKTMTVYIYHLECGHQQKHARIVKLQKRFSGSYRWCSTCRTHKKVIKMVIENFKQPKLTSFKEAKPIIADNVH